MNVRLKFDFDDLMRYAEQWGYSITKTQAKRLLRKLSAETCVLENDLQSELEALCS